MISYKLAKQLKNAGFPMKDDGTLEGKKYIPLDISLEELIKACGDGFNVLMRIPQVKGLQKPEWEVIGEVKYTGELTFIGRTPEIAVAKLWLKINSKVVNKK